MVRLVIVAFSSELHLSSAMVLLSVYDDAIPRVTTHEYAASIRS